MNLLDFFETGRRITDWGIGMFRAQYNDVLDLYSGFEALANGFLDDQVRSTLLLYCGISLDQLDRQLMDLQTGFEPGDGSGGTTYHQGTESRLCCWESWWW